MTAATPDVVLPSDVEAFVADDPALLEALSTLAAAESLTDEVALALLDTRSAAPRKELVVRALHLCDFVVERNSEWHLREDARTSLLALLDENPEAREDANRSLLGLAKDEKRRSEFREIPRYLLGPVGLAYHLAYVDEDGALARYAAIAQSPVSGDLWLAAQLSQEQVTRRVLPSDRLETEFIRGMLLYRERKKRAAIRVLRTVADAEGASVEIAIAAHLVGAATAKRKGSEAEAERYLRRSLDLGAELGSERTVAYVCNSLGRLLSLDANRGDEAEALLLKSLEIGEALGDRTHIAQASHSIGLLLARDPERRDAAVDALRRSLGILEEIGDRGGVAQVSYSLGVLLSHSVAGRDEARQLLRTSAQLNRDLGLSVYIDRATDALAEMDDPEVGETWSPIDNY